MGVTWRSAASLTRSRSPPASFTFCSSEYTGSAPVAFFTVDLILAAASEFNLLFCRETNQTPHPCHRRTPRPCMIFPGRGIGTAHLPYYGKASGPGVPRGIIQGVAVLHGQ